MPFVAETWPDFARAGTAQAMLPVCYEAFARSGKMAKEAAEPKIEKAHQAVIEKYPDCPLAERSYFELGRLNFERAQWDQAALYFGRLLERFPGARQGPLPAVYLGMTFEKTGKPEVAAELYRTFLDIKEPNDPDLKRWRAALEEKDEVVK